MLRRVNDGILGCPETHHSSRNGPTQALSCHLAASRAPIHLPSFVSPFGTICQAVGKDKEYNPGAEEFICPCHQSHYDPSVSGMIVIGQAELPLPRVTLEIDTFGNIFATGVTELIYGYQNNLKNGTQVPLWSQEGS